MLKKNRSKFVHIYLIKNVHVYLEIYNTQEETQDRVQEVRNVISSQNDVKSCDIMKPQRKKGGRKYVCYQYQ